jgi:hypothetical protein
MSARDFTIMVHWRLQKDGTVIMVWFSEELSDELLRGSVAMRPSAVAMDTVRGEVVLGGYIIKPGFSGIHVQHVLQVLYRVNYDVFDILVQ